MSLKQVDVRTAHKLQTEDEHAYVDVRSVPEFESGHPAGARNVPLLHLDQHTRRMVPNPDFLTVIQANFGTDTKLLLGCQMGGRSAQAGQMLVVAGYEDVSNVAGGFAGARDQATGQVVAEGWADAGLPVEQDAPSDNQYETLKNKA